jgi:hypothetical protein
MDERPSIWGVRFWPYNLSLANSPSINADRLKSLSELNEAGGSRQAELTTG